MSVARARTMLRASAGLIVHPSRLRQWRQHLGHAWRSPSSDPRRAARPRHLPGPSPRAVRALVIGGSATAERLRPEWDQVDWVDGPIPAADLVVIVWPGEHEPTRVAPSLPGVPLVIWDDAPPGSPASPAAAEAEVVLVSCPDRAVDYPDAPVLVQRSAVQPRLHNPATGAASRVPAAQLAGAADDPLLDPLGSLLGPAVQTDRAYDVVTVRGADADPDRVLELLAEGTVVVAADQALQELSSAITVVGSTEAAQQELTALAAHGELRRRRSLLGVRETLTTATTTVAVDAVLARLDLGSPRRARPVSVIVPTMRPEQIPHVLDFIERQSHPQVQLILVTHGFAAEPATGALAQERGVDLRTIVADADLTLGALMNLGVDAADGEYVAKMDDDNFYGGHYLADLLATFDFSGAQVAGKWAHLTYLQSSGATFLRFPQAENTLTRLVQGGTLVMPRDIAVDLRFEDLPRRVDTTFLEKVATAGGTVYSADRYNFVSVRGANVDGHTWKITDSELLAKPSAELFFGKPWVHADI